MGSCALLQILSAWKRLCTGTEGCNFLIVSVVSSWGGETAGREREVESRESWQMLGISAEIEAISTVLRTELGFGTLLMGLEAISTDSQEAIWLNFAG